MRIKFYNFNIIIILLIFHLITISSCTKESINNEKHKKKKHKKKYEKDNSVIIMKDNNFNKIISKLDILVLFYKKNETRSEFFMPTYTQASLKLSNNKPPLYFGKIECNENPIICSKEDLKQMPSIKYFKKGKSFLYYGTSDIEGILKFMWKNTLPPISDLMTLAEIADFKNTHEITVIYFGKDEKIINIIKENALDDADIFYGKVDFEKAYETYGANKKKDTIILFKKYGEERTEISGKLSKEGILNFITNNSVDKILGGTERAMKLIWGAKRPGLFLFADPNDVKTPFLRRTFEEVSEKVGNRICVVVMGLESAMEQKINTLTLVKPQDLPTIRIYDATKGPYAFHLFNKNEPMDTKHIMIFVEKFLSGKLQYFKLSEEIPKTQRGYMREIVGVTFEKEVFYNHKHVIVIFFDPYKAPLYQDKLEFMEQFAKKIKMKEILVHSNKMKDKEGKDINETVVINSQIIVGKMDLSLNDPEMNIDYGGLPSIQLFLDEDKNSPIRFDGELNEQNLVEFLEKYTIDKDKEKNLKGNKNETNSDL